MEEVVKSENHLTSAAAFVEGGIQDACDDACSICLEAFCESDPSTVTSCKHEFHLQCILEWCQRSSQCPMCWQSISLKDPSSQELLDAIEHEKTLRMNPPRNTTIFHHPTLGDFELQHLPVSVTDAELEERIIQHLAAAAAMGRARHIARREGQRSRSSTQARPHFLVFSSHPDAPSIASVSSSPTQGGEGEPVPSITVASPTSPPLSTLGEDSTPHANSSQPVRVSASASRSSVLAPTYQGTSSNNQRSHTQTSPTRQDGAGQSEFQSFPESLKSRFNAMSMRYKESITKSTRGWKERLFSRNTNMSDLGSEVRREVNAGIATISRMMEHLDTRDNTRMNAASVSNSLQGSSDPEPCQTASESNSSQGSSFPDPGNQHIPDAGVNNSLNDGITQSHKLCF
ncbi:E3 ubiquitin-protein ligase RHF2A-like isoform X2 [Diospyros lotus]|nr:E3 ubiquitin-protein ligase RHF2A-like isoform X2 [Diospyros lotus]XP_052174821.1 E3 ubiquitin-protein ligase RHF2A-like isoform X2 [Diospyros lotus]XP_052174822.1 E3 ubiquitin-protein ligase RHF2A-like isoform X2 [Diospyros lotus]XP_052174823.1 E3 ubiquitin-protein ligase RHF2A-like isoform X2 [Diospyros lotus]